MIDVQEAVRSLLMDNEVIQGQLVVDGTARIYPNVAPEFMASDVVEQYIVYTVISRVRSRTVRTPERLAQTRLQLDAYARSYEQVQTLAEAISSATDGWRGEVSTANGTLDIASIALDSTEDLYEETADAREFGWYRVSIDLLIWHEMNRPAVARP